MGGENYAKIILYKKTKQNELEPHIMRQKEDEVINTEGEYMEP